MKAEGTKVACHMLCCAMMSCWSELKGAPNKGMHSCDVLDRTELTGSQLR